MFSVIDGNTEVSVCDRSYKTFGRVSLLFLGSLRKQIGMYVWLQY